MVKSIGWEVSVVKTLCLVGNFSIVKFKSFCKEVHRKILLKAHIKVEILKN